MGPPGVPGVAGRSWGTTPSTVRGGSSWLSILLQALRRSSRLCLKTPERYEVVAKLLLNVDKGPRGPPWSPRCPAVTQDALIL